MTTRVRIPLRRLAAGVVLAAAAAAAALTVAALTPQAPPPRPAAASHAGLEVVPMRPQALARLKAQGKAAPTFIGTTANRGRKFNPSGGLIPALSTAAQQRVLVLFVKTTDDPPGGPAQRVDLHQFDDMLFGTTYDPPAYNDYPGHPTGCTLVDYYDETTYGKVDVVTLDLPSSTGWLQAPNPYSYYCQADGVHDNGMGPYPENAQGLVIDAVKAADPFVDFSKYAVNGVVPNLFVVHTGTGAEWSAAPDIIWSHSWDLSEGTGLNGYVADGVKVNNYAMMPEVGGDTTGYQGWVSGPYPATVGVYAHEYGHVLGLPDQYDYGYDSNGVGIYSLMSFGSWNQWPDDEIFAGNSPSELDAWSKYRLGLVTPQVVTSPRDVTLKPAETDSTVYKMVVPGSGGKESFLFENRQNIGFDKGLFAWRLEADGSFTPVQIHGLAVWHVDDGVFSRIYWNPNEAQNWKEFRSEGWRKAWTGETHYAISLLQADDRWDLERNANGGDPRDLYPGVWNVTSLGSTTLPNTSAYYFWLGSDPKYGYSGVTARDIAENGQDVSMRLSFVPYKGTP